MTIEIMPDSHEVVEDLLTVEDVAALLKVKPSWVYERIRSRKGEKLPHVKLGHYVRFERAAVEEFIERQRKAYFATMRSL
jgi:excisionase family DNA binding protein